MIVKSFLVQKGAAATSLLAAKLQSLLPLDALVLLSLGVDHVELVKAAKELNCPVFLSETYGILGYDEELGKNIELMEKGRGQEYGYSGGSGGTGCLAIGIASSNDGTVVCGTTKDFPNDASSMMVIADQSGAWGKDRSKAPVHFGGITKATWLLDSGDLKSVPYFWIADTGKEPTGVATFTDNADSATAALLEKMPSGFTATGSVGIFPCFTRGVNLYGEEHIEPTQTAQAFPGTVSPRVYGMFAHGELGPSSFAGFVNEPNNIPCTQHSMTTILSIHTTSNKY